MKSHLLAGLILVTLTSSFSRAVEIETVVVGNPGNAPDSTGFGAVPYRYRMGKYEVTNAQYVEFLNAVDPAGVNQLGLYKNYLPFNDNGGVLFNAASLQGAKYEIKPGYDSDPIVFATWYNAARFVNWLHNDQGGPGTTED